MKNKVLFNSSLSVCLILGLSMASSISLYAQEAKIRIIEKNAVLRLKPSEESVIIKKLPIGAELKVVKTTNDWVMVEMPPDEDGFVIIGYVHSSFVEFEIESAGAIKKIEPPIIKKTEELKLEKEKSTDELFSWRQKLAKAKSRRSTGTVLAISGGIVFTACMVLTFAHQEPEFDFPYFKKKSRIGYVIGDAIGLAALITGLAISLPASGEIKEIEEEGKIKGYIKAGALPEYRAVGFQFILSF